MDISSNKQKLRRKSKSVSAGSLVIGGDAPVSIQSMTNKPIEDVKGSIEQIQELALKGADLVRVAVRNEDAIMPLKEIIKQTSIPLCADIHFNYRLALGAIDAGIHKIRINPGNIGSEDRVKMVVNTAKSAGVPIRIGVNGGSVDLKKYGEVTPETLVASAMEHVHILEENDFTDIVVSIKSSDVFQTIEANKLFSKERDYAIHIGLTEAGYGTQCIVQSSIVIGHLLLNGIGDTIRVSMTGDPVNEIEPALHILKTTGLRQSNIRLVSCPTCGRTDPSLDILSLSRNVENNIQEQFGTLLQEKQISLTVAVMGCEVNGPGEAKHADFGLAGGRNDSLLLFGNGEIIRKVNSKNAVEELLKEIDIYLLTCS